MGIRSRIRDDRGSVVPLLALVLTGFVAVTGLILITAEHQVTVARAGWAADSAALAAAAAGPGDAGRAWAETLAEANGAELVRHGTVEGGAVGGGAAGPPARSWSVVVEVRIDGITAQAAAHRVPNPRTSEWPPNRVIS